MKYVLVDRGDNIIDKADIKKEDGLSAKKFFVKRKQIDEKEFDNMWRVLTEEQYNTQKDLSNRENKQYEWWKDDQSYLDIDK
tara:strand:- start:20 stop:265 length:246 start_codon:yes stop_codon:yes gene_type:complete